jgi:hypothetical protein
MVEIALCLAIIGFALVAIIGVLPMGLNVQKENREETIINQDAVVWIDALRAGGTNQFGVAENLTNYVDRVVWQRYFYASSNAPIAGAVPGYPKQFDKPFFSGYEILGILGTPHMQLAAAPNPDGAYFSNYVYAYVRAMSGVAADLPPQDNRDIQDNAFSYKLIVQSTPVGSHDANYANILTNQTDHTLRENLRDVRLLFRWPLRSSVQQASQPDPAVGIGRLVYRMQVSGRVTLVNQNVQGQPVDLSYLQSRDYQK